MGRRIDLDTGEITDRAQPALIPMSDEELRAAGQQLARKIRELATLKAEHADIRKEQKMDEERLENAIAGIAETIRTMGR